MNNDNKENGSVNADGDRSWAQKGFGYEIIAGEFVENATIHGVSHLIGSKSNFRRTVWLILFLGSLVFLIFGVHANIYKLREHGVVLKTALRHSNELPFPALTLCNINFIRKSKAGSTLLLDFFKYLMQGEKSNVNASQKINLLETVKYAGHDIRDMLKECIWKGQRCGPENFTVMVDKTAGRCFIFNFRKNVPLFAKDDELDANLVLTLDVQPEEYYDPWNDRVGFRVQLHESGKTPEVSKRGLLIAPGFSYDMTITRQKSPPQATLQAELYQQTTLLPDPYPSGCVLDTDATYSVADCQNKCLDKLSFEICNCTKSEGKKLCTMEQTACLFVIKAKSLDCRCPPPCVSVTYQTDLSGAAFPAPHKWPYILRQYNISSSNDTAAFKKAFRQRYSKISVSFRTFNTKEWEELPAYELRNLFCDLGGTMGLCLGCSIMSVCEIIELFISLMRFFATRSRTRKVQENLPQT